MEEQENNRLPQVEKMVGPNELLSASWQVYRKHFWSFVGILSLAAIVSLVIIVLGVIISLMTGGWALLSFFNSDSVLRTLPIVSIFVFTIVFLMFLSLHIMVQILGTMALTLAVRDRNSGIEIIDSYKKAWPYVRPYLWTTVLSGLVALLGFILLIIPGIILTIQLIFVPFVVLIEGLSGSKALARSRQYVRGRWWKVVGRLAILWFIFYAVSISVTLSAALLINEIIASFLGNIAFFVLVPFGMIYVYLLYENVKSLHGSN